MGVGRVTAGRRCSDEQAHFDRLYTDCYESIRLFCARRVPAEAVDDAVAETFLTVWRRLDEVPGGDAALVWMYGVAFRVVGHQWRATARRGRLQSRLRSAGALPVGGADEAALDVVEHRLVLAALARLKSTDAEMLRLVAWEQLSVTNVAAVLGIEPDAARQRLHRARRNLAREYDRLRSRSSTAPAAVSGGDR